MALRTLKNLKIYSYRCLKLLLLNQTRSVKNNLTVLNDVTVTTQDCDVTESIAIKCINTSMHHCRWVALTLFFLISIEKKKHKCLQHE